MRKLLLVLLLALAGMAWAAGPGVVDDAHLFSSSTVQTANRHLAQIASQAHKNVMIVTVPSLNGQNLDAVKSQYAGGTIPAIFVLIDKAGRKTYVNVGNRTAEVFTQDRVAALRDAFNRNFRAGNYDAGLQDAVTYIEQTFAAAPRAGNTSSGYAPAAPAPSGGINWGFLILVGLGIMVVLAIVRGIAGRGGGYVAGTPYGGYGPMMMGTPRGGGGFWSGLLGGVGGSFLGNALYDHFERRNEGGGGWGQQPPVEPSQPDWQQPDTSSSWDTGSSWDTSSSGGGDWSGGGGGGWS